MIGPRAGTRVWLAAGVTDMRCGMDTLAAKVQTALTEDPYSDHVFVFRGRRGDLIKSCGATVTVCACWPSAWSEVDSSGPKPRAE